MLTFHRVATAIALTVLTPAHLRALFILITYKVLFLQCHLPYVDSRIHIPVMMCATYRTHPLADAQVFDLLVTIATNRT